MEDRNPWIDVGQRLGTARRQLRISKREAARRAGFSDGQWRVLEAGRRIVAKGIVVPPNPKDETLQGAAEAVGIDPAELFRLVGRDFVAGATPPPPANGTDPSDLARRVGDLELDVREIRTMVQRVLDDPPARTERAPS